MFRGIVFDLTVFLFFFGQILVLQYYLKNKYTNIQMKEGCSDEINHSDTLL